jgi:DNA polymerase-3 subunit gamma/tau
VTEVRRLWPEVLEEVKGKRRFTWILLSQNAHVTEVRNGTLVLSMPNGGARDSFAKGGSEDVLREALVVVLGADLRIEAIVDPSTAAIVSAPTRASAPERAAASWDAPPPAAPAAVPAADDRDSPSAPPEESTQTESPNPPDQALRDQARQRIRPTRKGNASDPEAVDDRDAAADRDDSDLEENAESHTELLARHLGAEIIAEEEHGA